MIDASSPTEQPTNPPSDRHAAPSAAAPRSPDPARRSAWRRPRGSPAAVASLPLAPRAVGAAPGPVTAGCPAQAPPPATLPPPAPPLVSPAPPHPLPPPAPPGLVARAAR
ncbi:hypothetical protein OY671_007056, partial [Metschnikowia pulcherrima]